MTPQDILARLFTDKGVTPARVQKARGLANRQRLDWALVLAAMTPEQRTQVEG